MTIAVVSYDTRELLLECLASLAGEAHAGRARVVVVDNGSRDASAAAAREAAPWAEVLEPGQNLGFGRAVNLVAERSRGPWLACANADVALEPGALAALLAAGERDRRIGALAPRLILPDGGTQHSAYPFPTPGFTLALNLGVQHLAPRLAERWCMEGHWDPDRARAVPWAIGAFLLLRREAFDQAGGFDPGQWLYAEDLDLGWRLAQRGWITWYVPRARVRHHSGASTAVAFGEGRTERFTIATYEVIERRLGRAPALGVGAINLAGAAARVALAAPLAPWHPRARRWLASSRRWLAAHRAGAGSRIAAMRAGEDMREFWNARAREDAFYFVDTRQPYRRPDHKRFWEAEELLDYALGELGVSLAPDDEVLEIGCGIGRITRVLAARARHVTALDVSDEMLTRAAELNPGLGARVRWLLGDGRSLAGVEDAGADACVSLVALQHVPDPGITLGYVRELGRVLRPGGWAALQVSNDPALHRARNGVSWRAKALVGRAPRGQRHPAWLGSHVELDDVRRAGAESGLELERVWGEGSQYCLLLLRAQPRR